MADTLVSEIIVQAFREGNFTAVGETTTAEELKESVPRLNNYIASLFGLEMGEMYRDWYAPTAWESEQPLRHPLTPDGSNVKSTEPWAYPPANVRLVVKATAAKTIYFPAYPSDGARMAYADVGSTALVTLDGNGRRIEAAVSITEAAAGAFAGRSWLYRADLGDWIRLKTLASTDTVPLPPEFDDLLVTGLAIRLASRMGVKQIDPQIVARHDDMLGRLKKRYKQTERMPTSVEMRSLFREI